jgi:tetratricopeptide (TPR) repeat protein
MATMSIPDPPTAYRQPALPHALAAALALLSLASLAACGGKQAARGAENNDGESVAAETDTATPAEPMVAAYRAGNYTKALAEAEKAVSGAEGKPRERAALMAGLSNYALRRPESAAGWLTPLENSTDAEIAGRAAWTLGLIAADRGNHSKASTLLTSAAAKLSGDEAGQAGLAAADSLARLGRTGEARSQLAAALQTTEDPALKTLIQARIAQFGGPSASHQSPGAPLLSASVPPGTKYIIQLGAFSDKTSADRLAATNSARTAAAGQGTPRVVMRQEKSTGRRVYAVRVGVFNDRPTAESALARMGIGGTVMADLP